MTQCGAEADPHGHSKLLKAIDTNSSHEVKAKTIKAKYQAKIKTVEQELHSCTDERTDGIETLNRQDLSQNDALETDAAELKTAIRILAYEIEVAQERVKAEEARNALWTTWSATAERTASHRPTDQSIVAAFDMARISRQKVTAAVQNCVRDEQKGTFKAQIPSWLKSEPAWPAEIKHDAWWPMRTAADTEKTRAVLVASADRAVNLARKIMFGTSKHSLQMETRGQLALIAAKEARQGSSKIISELATAASHLKQFSGPTQR